MNSHWFSHALGAALALALTLTITPAFAEPSVTVRFSDLDLRTRAGVRVLDQRIDAAVEQLCRIDNSPLVTAAPEHNCREAMHEIIRTQRQAAIAQARQSEQLASK